MVIEDTAIPLMVAHTWVYWGLTYRADARASMD